MRQCQQDHLRVAGPHHRGAQGDRGPVRAARFIDDAGNVRKVVGTLTTTADDMIAGAGRTVGGPTPSAWTLCCSVSARAPCIPMTRLYGSREAAKEMGGRGWKAVKP